MYNPFFEGNIFAYLEFVLLLGILGFFLCKNISKVNIMYMHQFNRFTKVTALIVSILLSAIVYTALAQLGIHWIIGVAVNALLLVLILYFTIAVFWGRKK